MTQTETKVKFKPLADRVLLEVIDESDKTAGGIYIPETAKEKPMKGRVIAIGQGRLLDNGQREEMNVKTGDVVLFSKYGGTEIKLGTEDFKILSEKDILGIIEA